MTYLYAHLEAGRYTVLEFPRGPRIGTVRNAGTRQWLAECDQPGCAFIDEGRTRPAAAAQLDRHNRRAHR